MHAPHVGMKARARKCEVCPIGTTQVLELYEHIPRARITSALLYNLDILLCCR